MTTEQFKIDVLPHKNKLFRLALRLLANYQEAEDTVQEVYLRLWSKRETLKELRSIEAFAITITKNLCLDKLRQKKDHKSEIENLNLEEKDKKPDEKTEMKDTLHIINKIIGELPDLQKIIIQLRDIEGYEFEEMQEILNINVNAIRVNLSRARKKVREELIKAQRYEYSAN